MKIFPLKETISYDPETGLFTWLEGRYKGKTVAGTLDPYGYRKITVNGTPWMSHRLAWFLTHDTHPKEGYVIDHVNMIKDDNRLSNLREATRAESAWNVKKQKNNTSGFRGVTYNKANDSWIAQIREYGVPLYLGSYKTKVEAAFAYQTYAAKIQGEFYNGVQ